MIITHLYEVRSLCGLVCSAPRETENKLQPGLLALIFGGHMHAVLNEPWEPCRAARTRWKDRVISKCLCSTLIVEYLNCLC